ncbi:MAG: hypothetical protein JO255_05020 [Alphaproteobacteria bacterium]|nr:hypothetical protein [Alphaproteobacteria bacterium]
MRGVLQAAKPLGEVVWAVERKSETLDTPERRAALEQRLENRVRSIADRNVADKYRQFFREKLQQTFAGVRRPGPSRRGGGAGWKGAPPPPGPPPDRPDPRAVMQRRQQEILVATIINHPALLHGFAEDFADLDLTAPDLDKLRREIINVAVLRPDLDAAALTLHLCQNGFARAVDGLLSPQVYVHGAFARPDADIEDARQGWLHARHMFQQLRQLAVEIGLAAQGLAEEMTEAKLAQLTALQDQREDEDGMTGLPGGMSGGGVR